MNNARNILVVAYYQAMYALTDRWVEVIGTSEHTYGWTMHGRVGRAMQSQRNPHRLRVQFLKPGCSPYEPHEGKFEFFEYTPDRLKLWAPMSRLMNFQVWTQPWWFPLVLVQKGCGHLPKRLKGETQFDWMWRHMVAGVPHGPWSRKIKALISGFEGLPGLANAMTVAQRPAGVVFYVPSLKGNAYKIGSGGDLMLFLADGNGARRRVLDCGALLTEDYKAMLQAPQAPTVGTQVEGCWFSGKPSNIQKPKEEPSKVTPTVGVAYHPQYFMFGDVWG